MSINTRSKVSRGTLERESLIQVETEKVEMTLNTDSAVASGLLIQRLTELYEDPVEASVRETISNALDAVVEAHSGEIPEIRITTPSSLNPIFTVRDNGVGMTYNDLKEIYSKYGASTKMDNMDQIGAYGLGAKAPLAYGTEFTVSSIKDGERTTIIVVREELTNYIKIVDSGPTDSPSGTSVSIPVNSNDIQRFKAHIEKYHENPVDKTEVRMIIDGEEIEESSYVEIADNVVIFNDGDNEITGRIWVTKDTSSIERLISGMSESEMRESFNYLIGGWSYKRPASRGRRWGNTQVKIMIELKAGIVAFNSSRDSILDNDRYSNLEELIIEHIESSVFMDQLIRTVNNSKLETFKSVVVNFLSRHERNVRIENGEIKVKKTSGSNLVLRDVSISEFIHSETGFKFEDIFQGVPKEKKETAIVLESLESYRKVADNYIPSTREKNSHLSFRSSQIASVIENIDSIMRGEKDSVTMESIMLYIGMRAYRKQHEEDVKITFITDIDENEDDKSYSRVRTGRRTIVRMRNGGEKDKYQSFLIYTAHSKTAIEKMIEKSTFEDLDIKIETAKDMTDQIAEYRKANRTARKASPNQGVQTAIMKMDEDSQITRIDVDKLNEEFDSGKKNIIIVSKDRVIRSKELSMIEAWYCNEKNVSPDEIQLYLSIGQHRKLELEILSGLGELYEDPHSSDRGRSKMYDELLSGRAVGAHALNKHEDDLERKAFIRLLTSLGASGPLPTKNKIITELNNSYSIAQVAGYDMPALDKSTLNEVVDVGLKKFGDSYRMSDWTLTNESSEQLVSLIDEDKYELIELLSLYCGYRNRRINIDKDGKVSEVHVPRAIIEAPSLIEIEGAYKDNREDDLLSNLTKAKVTAYLDFTKVVIEKLAAMRFS